VTVPAVQWQFATIRDDAGDCGISRERPRSVHRDVPPPNHDGATDEALLAQLVAGNEHALTEVFDRFLTPLVRFADATLGTHGGAAGEAGDVVSDVLVALWDRRASLEEVRNLRAYLYRAVRNQALNWRRAEEREHDRYMRLVTRSCHESCGAPFRRCESRSAPLLSFGGRTVCRSLTLPMSSAPPKRPHAFTPAVRSRSCAIPSRSCSAKR
jgi:hypothetical protein